MNYAEIEPNLVAFVKSLPLYQRKRLRLVDTLPELSEDALVKKFGQDAPAIYVSVGAMSRTDDSQARYRAAFMLVSRNASGFAGPRHDDARRGEGRGDAGLIGLNEMLGHLVPYVHQAEIGGVDWRFVDGGTLVEFPAMWAQGLYATTINIESDPVAIDTPIDESTLDDFAICDAEWNLGPEPDDHVEARDRITLPTQQDETP